MSYQVDFTAPAIIGTVTNYHWDFGDGSNEDTGIIPIVTHFYNALGTYNMVLTVTTTNGTGISEVCPVAITLDGPVLGNDCVPSFGFGSGWEGSCYNSPTAGVFITSDGSTVWYLAHGIGAGNLAVDCTCACNDGASGWLQIGWEAIIADGGVTSFPNNSRIWVNVYDCISGDPISENIIAGASSPGCVNPWAGCGKIPLNLSYPNQKYKIVLVADPGDWNLTVTRLSIQMSATEPTLVGCSAHNDVAC